jgi:hypothetical protein
MAGLTDPAPAEWTSLSSAHNHSFDLAEVEDGLRSTFLTPARLFDTEEGISTPDVGDDTYPPNGLQ